MYITVPQMNMALNSLSLVVILIIMATCITERIKQRLTNPPYFIYLLTFISISLVFDVLSWACEGDASLRLFTLVLNTLTSCAGQISIFCFMKYMSDSLYVGNKIVPKVVDGYGYFCLASIIYAVGNIFFGYSFVVSPEGHYVASGRVVMLVFHLLFSMAGLLSVVPFAWFAKRASIKKRILFTAYALLPAIGIILDYTVHELSLTYVGTVISILIIYTNIHIDKQRLIDQQKNALMLSQINPHFTYNTLTAIAAMCDSDPKLAKSLTIDFSQFLRQNLDSMTSERMIPFAKELEHVECYLKIEQARFRERLNVIWSVKCSDFEVPPLTVQPLVENAIKHGITKKPAGGTVKISAYAADKTYVIEVIDDGVGFDKESLLLERTGHIGLDNVESRLKRVCLGTLSVKSEVGIGTRVTIEIPKRKVT